MTQNKTNIVHSMLNPAELETIKKLAAQLKSLLSPEKSVWVDDCLALYERQEVVLMIAGEVSVGKSSLLNALLGRDVLLTDLTETTAAITFLRSAEGNREARADMAKVTYNNGKIEWLGLNKKELEKVTTSLENDDALTKVKQVEIFLSGNIIPRGVTIVDTPGLNGGDRHSALTHREMGLCHAALFLLDASKAGTMTEKRELNKLYDYAPEVLFVLSKWDQVRKAFPNDGQNAIKRKYLNAIGRITQDSGSKKTISAESIYVVSAKEGLEAYRRAERDHNQKPLKEYLPDKGRDNEIFDLFVDVIEKLQQGERQRLMRLRPLITMRNLALEALEERQERLKQAADVTGINAEINKLELELERRKSVQLERIRRIAERIMDIAQNEQKELDEELEKDKTSVLQEVNSELEEVGNEQILQPQFRRKIKGDLDSLIDRELVKPIQGRVDDFLTLVNYSLESNEELTMGLPAEVEMPTASRKSSATSVANEFQGRVNDLNEEIEGCQKHLRSLQDKKEETDAEYERCSVANREMQRLDSQINGIVKKIKAMGTRPDHD